jgi:4-diphosphocytidyl-2-C-methyl-D-erythritol kinase
MKVKVNAKLNLTLGVLGRDSDYHNLQSIAISVDIYDTVKVNLRTDKCIKIYADFDLPPERNIAFKAAKAFQSHYDTVGCDIHITKGIPMFGGLGGSSADAAATLFALYKMHLMPFDVALEDMANSLGSDVLYMLRGGLALIEGRGDKVTHFDCPPTYHFVVTHFEQGLQTSRVFAKFDTLPPKDYVGLSASPVLELITTGKLDNSVLHNDLERAARAMSSYADSYLSFCRNFSLAPNLTGSGSAYFILASGMSDALNTALMLNANGFKSIACQSQKRGIEILEE